VYLARADSAAEAGCCDTGCAMLINTECSIDHDVQHECEGNCDLAG
jgi:hypothetical protein